jgi:hypothetical protein
MRKSILILMFIALSSAVHAWHDTTLVAGSIAVDFRFPETAARGAILVLPGWNFSKSDVCEKSDFCSEALKQGYILILPEMLKSVYASSLFPETRADWRKYPQVGWVSDTLIPFCREKFGLLKDGGENFLYGISTGARGVALVAEKTGRLFRAGVALSGDYDQTTMTSDRLMSGFYGAYDQFRERWEGDDNPGLHSDRLKIPLYIAHGIKDAIVPCQQSIAFSRKIIFEEPGMGHAFHLCDTCGHNYDFWNSETGEALRFFEKHR